MPLFCCVHGGRRGRREDVYKVQEPREENDESAVKQFSWDKRGQVDMDKLTVRNEHEQTIVKRDFKGEPVIIENCIESVIVILGHTAAVNIDDCRDCTFVLGPCSGSIFIRDCESCRILAICQQFRTRDCNGLIMALRCMSEPIIEQSTDVVLHPLAIYYQGIVGDVSGARLSFDQNLATTIHDFTPNKSKANYKLKGTLMRLTNDLDEKFTATLVSTKAEDTAFPLPECMDYPIFCAYSLLKSASSTESWDSFVESIEQYKKIIKKMDAKIDITPENGALLAIPFTGHSKICILACTGDLDAIMEALPKDLLFGHSTAQHLILYNFLRAFGNS